MPIIIKDKNSFLSYLNSNDMQLDQTNFKFNLQQLIDICKLILIRLEYKNIVEYNNIYVRNLCIDDWPYSEKIFVACKILDVVYDMCKDKLEFVDVDTIVQIMSRIYNINEKVKEERISELIVSIINRASINNLIIHKFEHDFMLKLCKSHDMMPLMQNLISLDYKLFARDDYVVLFECHREKPSLMLLLIIKHILIYDYEDIIKPHILHIHHVLYSINVKSEIMPFVNESFKCLYDKGMFIPPDVYMSGGYAQESVDVSFKGDIVPRDSVECVCICGKKYDLQRCSRCKKVYYCGRKCQSDDYAKHKLFCLA